MNLKLVHKFSYNAAFTFGYKDKEKREIIREEASKSFKQPSFSYNQVAFKITVIKSGKRSFDLDNVPKLIIDSFCLQQINKDNSTHVNLGLYNDDTLDNVVKIEMEGRKAKKDEGDLTIVEIYGVVNN